MFRVLKAGGEFHIADWGRPRNALMRVLFTPVRSLDGFENTKDNIEGRLPELFTTGDFEDVQLRSELSTLFGTLAFYSGKKPSAGPRRRSFEIADESRIGYR